MHPGVGWWGGVGNERQVRQGCKLSSVHDKETQGPSCKREKMRSERPERAWPEIRQPRPALSLEGGRGDQS